MYTIAFDDQTIPNTFIKTLLLTCIRDQGYDGRLRVNNNKKKSGTFGLKFSRLGQR